MTETYKRIEMPEVEIVTIKEFRVDYSEAWLSDNASIMRNFLLTLLNHESSDKMILKHRTIQGTNIMVIQCDNKDFIDWLVSTYELKVMESCVIQVAVLGDFDLYDNGIDDLIVK